MYSSFTFLELVKAISVHRAHRLLPEATLILCTWRNRLSRGKKRLNLVQNTPRAHSPMGLP
jgi:hypothetical protein